jgi:hypothetical protein
MTSSCSPAELSEKLRELAMTNFRSPLQPVHAQKQGIGQPGACSHCRCAVVTKACVAHCIWDTSRHILLTQWIACFAHLVLYVVTCSWPARSLCLPEQRGSIHEKHGLQNCVLKALGILKLLHRSHMQCIVPSAEGWPFPSKSHSSLNKTSTYCHTEQIILLRSVGNQTKTPRQ